MKKIFVGFLWFYLFALHAERVNASEVSLPATLRVCDDEDTWPPYLQYQLRNGERTGELEGYSLDLAKLILGNRKVQFKVEMLPWKRCLKGVGEGDFAMLLNAMSTPERSERYYATRPYYSLTPIYIYMTSESKPNILRAEDMAQYRLCGLIGYDYQPFRVKPEQIDQGAKSFEQVMEKLKRKRCDLVIGHYEIMAQRRTNEGTSVFKDPAYAFAKVPNLPNVQFVMLVSKNTIYGEELRAFLDVEISKVLNSPMDKLMRKKWGIDW